MGTGGREVSTWLEALAVCKAAVSRISLNRGPGALGAGA